MKHSINPKEFLSIEKLSEIISAGARLELSEEAQNRINACRFFLDSKIQNEDRAYYGINTGFGSLCNVKISKDDLAQLQVNLVRSHACGQGHEVPAAIVKLMLLLKIQSLSYGHSGVSVDTVEKLIQLYNEDYLPVVYEQGSLGASGDLAPLAHLSLPLIGEGECIKDGQKISGKEVAKKLGWKNLSLQSKEGLALLNGTQFMSAYGCYLILEAQKCFKQLLKVACVSLEAFDCTPEPFHAVIHDIRPHGGQVKVAAAVRQFLSGSEISSTQKTQVQDPYSFRCIPQVLGASWDVIEHICNVFEREINSVTDNPNIFPDENMIVSGGNFHGQPLAMCLDYLCLALAEIGNISERRTYWLLSGTRNLPTYLAKNPGINSGFMIPQYTAASIVSENKILCHPASIDSIPSSNGQEDHVSMGATAATKCLRVFENVQRIIAIELFTAAQALEFRRPKKSSVVLEDFVANYRKQVPFLEKDDYMREWMERSREYLS